MLCSERFVSLYLSSSSNDMPLLKFPFCILDLYLHCKFMSQDSFLQAHTWLHIYLHSNSWAFKECYGSGWDVPSVVHQFTVKFLFSWSSWRFSHLRRYQPIFFWKTKTVRAFIFKANVSLLHSWKVIWSDMVYATCKETFEGAAFVFAMADSRERICN